ncbi:MAG: hypothetical protein KF826_11850 [Xanthobacteraceae bacterium]|nr:hypothetical protein [Xanthobacteraceae bacterium]MBX3535035.1 hypothetical protein [Xanthobacteraceae bacterium]MCW5678619.1 hypothetical protein [Xanthobacteraceae bacterium]
MRKVSRQSLHMQGWAAFVLVALLAGCSTVENVMGPIGNMGDIFKQGPAPNDPDNPNANPNAQTQVNADENCPGATIRQGASAWAQNAGQGPTNVRYQASIVQIARECAVLGDTMTIKVGIEGRLLVGPKGGPGNVTVPLRIALVQEGPQPRPIISKFYAVNVSVPQGSTQVPFTQVEDDLTFPLPADKNLEKYVVYVGFDPQGAPPPAKKKAPVKKKAPPKKQVKKQAPAPQQQQQQPTFTAPPQQQPPTFTPPQQQQQAPSNVPTFDPPPRQ